MSDDRRPAADAGPEADPLLPSEAAPPDPADARVLMYAAERDSLLGEPLAETTLPESEDEFAARDPFSSDYLEFQKANLEQRRFEQRKVDGQLRADLLARPHLMKEPGESGTRGAAAVWRSLRDILRQESATLMDSSRLDELLDLKRELEGRKGIVEAVATGLDKQLQRLDQRIAAAREAEDAAARPDAADGGREEAD